MSPRDHLVGLPKAASIADPAMPVHDLYDEVGGVIYDLVTPTGCDEALPARYAQRHGGPALDLGCGSGRITVPLAARGIDVLGVDLSTAMLDRLTGVLENEHPDIQSRVRVMAADMTSLRLDEQFRLIVLGATSIVLVDPAQRVEFFRRVRDLLTPDGSDEICADLADAGMDVIETITDPASAFTWIVASSGQRP